MKDTQEKYVSKVQKNRKRKLRFTHILMLMSLMVFVNVFWNLRQTGVTMAGDATCGIPEHTHSDDCREEVLVCTIDEDEEGSPGHTHDDDCYEEVEIVKKKSKKEKSKSKSEDEECKESVEAEGAEKAEEPEDGEEIEIERVLVCEKEENEPVGPHVHKEKCYEVKLVCDVTEHTHEVECYADKNADVETEDDWEKAFGKYSDGEPTAEKLVELAETQIGYTESERNFEVDKKQKRHGYTRYGAWYGSPYSEWSGAFVSFCLNYAGFSSDDTPFNIGASSMEKLWKKADRFAVSDDYLPTEGDLVFFAGNSVGIVSYANGDTISVIRGGVDGEVCEFTTATYSDNINGFGILFPDEEIEIEIPEEPEEIEPLIPDEPSEPAEDGDKKSDTDLPDENDKSDDDKKTDEDKKSDDDTESKNDDSSDCENEDEKSDDRPSKPSKSDKSDKHDDEQAELTDDEFVLKKCDCDHDGEPIEKHVATCAYAWQMTALAMNKNVRELYEFWDDLPEDAQDYILDFLCENTDTYGDKGERLTEMLSAEVSITKVVGNASFTVTGKLPRSAELVVEDAEYSRETAMSYLKRNIVGYVGKAVVYDISILHKGKAYIPESPLDITVVCEDFEVTEDEYFCIAHLDEKKRSVIDSEYVEAKNHTVSFSADSFSPYMFYTVSKEIDGGELICGTNWIELRDSGWFEYWEQFLDEPTTEDEPEPEVTLADGENPPSDVQINDRGGETKSSDGKVIVSKTATGTDVENVFDITLTVQTEQNISEVYKEPDMAVVIVMDISNTMKDNFGNDTRYTAAMEAAEEFIDDFVANTGEVSRIGYVAFNTNAHEIFPLQACSTTKQAASLKNTMRQKTGNIINDSAYKESHDRFTNIEAGLKRGYDMLAKANNENKYIIFLSDGFPTTYISSGYSGYDPYDGKGVHFYDYIMEMPCTYGNSYSDRSAIKAREMATKIKNAGITIFSIGVDVGGQTVQEYVDTIEKRKGFSVVDRTSATYEIGSATSKDAYKNWLKNSIGSGEYYDSTNAQGLKDAYKQIFEKIKQFKEESSKADWVTQDPIPSSLPKQFEFIGFYDKNHKLCDSDQNLVGSPAEKAENTATFTQDGQKISWDLKDSGYTAKQSGTKTVYNYKLTYRIRLQNEVEGFSESDILETNETTTLTYRLFESIDGVTTLSKQNTIEYKIPKVHGYLGELEFAKKDTHDRPLSGAEFTLSHDTKNCTVCRGDGKNHVSGVSDCKATSDENGTVSFTLIPSGHVYTLTETKVPPGFLADGNTYSVTVAYNAVTVEAKDKNGGKLEWQNQITNLPIPYELPATGGNGSVGYLIAGSLLVSGAIICQYIRKRRQERRSDTDDSPNA